MAELLTDNYITNTIIGVDEDYEVLFMEVEYEKKDNQVIPYTKILLNPSLTPLFFSINAALTRIGMVITRVYTLFTINLQL